MVLYNERGACLAQTVTEVNAIGWPQTPLRIEEEKPKHIRNCRQGNEIFGSPPLASEANGNSQNENFPSQVHYSLSNETSSTYLTGSSDQEVTRCENYFQVPKGQSSSFFTNESQNYSQGPAHSMTSVSLDSTPNIVERQDPKENVPLSTIRNEMQKYCASYQGSIKNNQQRHMQQKQIQQQQKLSQEDQQDDEMLPFINSFLLSTNSLSEIQSPVSSSNQLPKDNQMNPQNQFSDQNKNTNSRCNFLQDFQNLYTDNITPINPETWPSLRSPPISLEETSLSRPAFRTCTRNSNSRNPNTPVSDSISISQSYCTDKNINSTYLGYQDAFPQNNSVANETPGTASWQVPKNGTSSNDPINRDLQALMILAGDSSKKGRGRQSVKATQRSRRSKKVLENSKQTIPYYTLLSQNAEHLKFVQQPYPQQSDGYLQLAGGYLQQAGGNLQQAGGHLQQPPKYTQQAVEYAQRQSVFTQQSGFTHQPSGYSQQPPRYSEQPGCNKQLCEYGYQLPGYTPQLSQQLSGCTQQLPGYNKQIFKPASRQQLSEYTQLSGPIQQFPRNMHQYPEYGQQFSRCSQQFLRSAQPCMVEYPIQRQQISVQNQQILARSQQHPSQTQQFHNQIQQLSGQTQPFSRQAQQLSGQAQHCFEKLQYLSLNKQPQHLLSPLQRLSSPLEHLPNQLEHLPENCQHFPSSNFPYFQNQANPQAIHEVLNEDSTAETPKLVRSWHIPEILPIIESNNKSSKHNKNPLVDPAEATEHSEDMTAFEFPDLPSVDMSSVLRSLPTNLDTASQMHNLGEESNQLQQYSSSPHKNVPEVSNQQILNLFQISDPNDIALVTTSPSCQGSQNSDLVQESPTTLLEGRDWLLKSPAPLEIDVPKDAGKRKQTKLRSLNKPHKGLKDATQKYRTKGIATRSLLPEIYLQEAARKCLEDIHDDKEGVEDEDYLQDAKDYHQIANNYHQIAKDNQSPQNRSSKDLVLEEELQKGKMISKDPTTSSEEINANFSKHCNSSKKKDLPTNLNIIAGRWIRSIGFKKREIHHQGLPNLQGLLLKSVPHKKYQKQPSSLNISIKENKQDVPKEANDVDIIIIDE